MAHRCDGGVSNGHPLEVTRRHFFRECGVGVGKIVGSPGTELEFAL